MNLTQKHLDKNNLHHAYLIEGGRDEVTREIFEFLESINFKTVGNSDLAHIAVDSFKIEDARNLKSFAGEKAMTNGKKIFVVSANNFLLEAQNAMLKLFEEPIENTHFFLIVPETGSLLETFVSRFYLIRHKPDLVVRQDLTTEAEAFLKMPLSKRLDFIKELIAISDEEDEDGNEVIVLNSTRARAQKFLNDLETALHQKLPKKSTGVDCFYHIFKVREFLRTPGSSTKTLLESVAIVVPNF